MILKCMDRTSVQDNSRLNTSLVLLWLSYNLLEIVEGEKRWNHTDVLDWVCPLRIRVGIANREYALLGEDLSSTKEKNESLHERSLER